MIEYAIMNTYGDFIELEYKLNDPKSIVEWTEENFTYVQYNPNKPIPRFGLSVTSLDGGLSGKPDLDSFWTGGNPDEMPTEMDINVPTPVYEHPEIKKLCEFFQPHVGRSHILKIPPGGYFPPHRDFKSIELDTFRIIVPLLNTEFPKFNFVLEDKILTWNKGSVYYLNTAKAHHLFNMGQSDSYWLVLNIGTNKESVEKVLKNMKVR
tara:strand:- start:1736 stop:2359 length:624 start_codon:yes stop_codon:yes gene_type:complete